MKMNRIKIWILVGLLGLAVVGGTAGLVAAQTGNEGLSQNPSAAAGRLEAHRGGGMARAEALADELGITVEELQAAHQAAMEAMRAQAIEDGWIDEASEANGRFRFGRSQYYRGIYDKEAYLADALGITVSELDAAKDAVFTAFLDEKVVDETITEEQAADIAAVRAYKDSIDQDAILAEALGISISELNEARDNTVFYSDLLDELGLTQEEVRSNTRAIVEEMIADAIESSELTEAQAQLLLRRGRGPGGHKGGHGPRGHGPIGNEITPETTGDNA